MNVNKNPAEFDSFGNPELTKGLTTTTFVTRLTNKRLNHRRHSRKAHKRSPKPKIDPTNIQPNLNVLEQVAPDQ